MSEPVRLEVHDGVAVITVDARLSAEVRLDLAAMLDAVDSDPDASAIVITSKAAVFCACAAITELDHTKVSPTLADLCTQIERCKTPVVAAIRGSAIGGGLEVAMSCHYRLSAPQGKFAFDAIALGLVPGAGGTQRAPRLIGAGPALDMILSGTEISAADALELGLIDEISDGDLFERAVRMAQDVREEGPWPTGERREFLDDGATFLAEVNERRTLTPPDDFARTKAIACVEGALLLPLDGGLALERQAFEDCLASATSQALRYAATALATAASFAETATIPDIDHIAIVGDAPFAVDFAIACLNAGVTVEMIAPDAAAVDTTLERVGAVYERLHRQGRVTEAAAESAVSLLRISTDLNSLATAHLIVEAAPEDMALKLAVLQSIAENAPQDAVLVTSTSALDLSDLGAGIDRARRLVGANLSARRQTARLVEIAATAQTHSDAILSVRALIDRIGRIPVRVVGGGRNGIAARMMARLCQVTDALLERGSSPAQIDTALRTFGFARGPYQLLDVTGLDTARVRRAASGGQRARLWELSDLLCDAGAVGRRVGRGYYLYDAVGRATGPNPEMQRFLEAIRQSNGIAVQEVANRMIVDHVVLALIDEGARLLDEGTVQRASDIDAVMLAALGYPRARGGPMFDADRVGAFEIARKITALAAIDPNLWSLAPLLERLARERETLGSVQTT